MKQIKQNNGITLIVLVIIIIAILVVAGVTLFIVFNNNNSTKNGETTASKGSAIDNSYNSNSNEKYNNNTKTENTVNENNTKITKVQQKEYTTLTLGKLKQSDKNEMPIGSKIKAYPLNIEEVLVNKATAGDYGDVYEKQIVAVKGYVHYSKDGYFILSPNNSENIDKDVGTIIVEDNYIKKDYNWDIKDGDFIEIAGYFRGAYIGKYTDYWIVLNNVFKVKE